MNIGKSISYIAALIFLLLGVEAFMLSKDLFIDFWVSKSSFKIELSNALIWFLLAILSFAMGHRTKSKKLNGPE